MTTHLEGIRKADSDRLMGFSIRLTTEVNSWKTKVLQITLSLWFYWSR
jgi:hypothetical protein